MNRSKAILVCLSALAGIVAALSAQISRILHVEQSLMLSVILLFDAYLFYMIIRKARKG